MATLKVIGSNSSGNGYIIAHNNETLILELGCKWGEYEKALNYDLSNITCCISSHLHADHSNPSTIKKALTRGIDVYSCQEVVDKFNGVKIIKPKTKLKIGGFSIQCFPLKHNAECYGYLIEHNSFGRLLFCTDCQSIPYKFKNINHYLIEANYSDETRLENAMQDVWSQSASENHQSIESCIEFLMNNYSGACNNVVLCHLSQSNANPMDFQRRVKEIIGIEPKIAENGLIVELNKEEF